MSIKKISGIVFSVIVLGLVFAINAEAAVPQITRDLTLGSTGDDVKSLQQYLNDNGYSVAPSGVGSKGNETFYFGNATQAALKKFQTANGITETGFGTKTRALLAILSGTSTTTTTTTTGDVTSQIATLRALIAQLQQRLDALLGTTTTTTTTGSDSTAPYISSIKVADGGDTGYIDQGDVITVTFSEAVDPKSINSSLNAGSSVSSVSYSATGGVRVSLSGVVTIEEIATFNMGSVEDAGTFTSKVALSSNEKVLTITITDGSDVKIEEEDFGKATQISGTIKDLAGNVMESSSSISYPTGTFGGTSDNEAPYISSISVSDGGDEGYIDVSDKVIITFSKAIDPESVNDDLDEGVTVTGVEYSDVGGITVSSSGKVTIKGIATFDMGSVEDSGNFTSKVALSSNGKILTITITSGSDIKIEDEDFSSATQVGGTIEDADNNEMESDSSIDDPSGTFGGTSSSGAPYISSIVLSNNGDSGYMDTGDKIIITFNEAIEPESVNDDLEEDDYVTGIAAYSEVGGVSVSSSGEVTVEEITSFDLGSVASSGAFTSKIALSSNGKVLTITLTDGSDVHITSSDLSDASQIGGTIKDVDDNLMGSDSSINNPTGSF
ncbi:MAG: peptidoglycan-binding domain-containing protein [Candidatus Pacearchaeota archaeon]